MTLEKRLVSCIVGLVVTTGYANPLSAQDSIRQLEEVLVTAQKREQRLQDVPISITALKGDFLEQTNTRDFAGIAKITPGLFISDTPDGFAQGISIRGVGALPFALGFRPPVTIFLDDRALSSLDSAFNNLMDVERIEILKGPQATLYGKEASSGAIVISTVKPALNIFEGGVDLEFADHGKQEYRGKLNLPLGDKFALRVSAYHSEFDGEIENILTGKERSAKNYGGRMRLLYQASEDLEIIFSQDYHSSEVRDEVFERVSYGAVSLLEDRQALITLPADPFDEKVEAIMGVGRDAIAKNSLLSINWNISDHWNTTYVGGISSWDRQLNQGDPLAVDVEVILPDFSRSIVTAGTATGGDGGALPFLVLPFHSDGSPDNEESYSHELRLAYESDSLSSLYGAYYSNTDLATSQSLLVHVASVNINLGVTPVKFLDTTDWSVFTHQTWHANEQWDLVLGLRYGETEKDDRNLTSRFTGLFGDGTLPVGPKQSDTWSNFSTSLKLVYAASDNISFYGGYAQGYKPGGFNSDPTIEAYDEETTINYEMGMKGRFLDNTLQLNAAVYYQTYDDYQVRSFNEETGGVTSIFNNAASVEVSGVEADFVLATSAHLTLSGAFSYIDSRYDDYENVDCSDTQKIAVANAGGASAAGCSVEDGILSQDLSGKRVAQNSPLTANLNAQWDAGFANGMGWFLRGEVAYTDDYNGLTTLDPLTNQDEKTLLAASAGLKAANGSWAVTVYGKNLANEDYASTFLPGRDGLGGYTAYKGPGRTIGVTGRYNF